MARLPPELAHIVVDFAFVPRPYRTHSLGSIVVSLAASHDGRNLAVIDHLLTVHHLYTNQISIVPSSNNSTACEWSRDGALATAVRDPQYSQGGCVFVWTPINPRVLLRTKAPVLQLRWSPDGAALAMVTESGYEVWVFSPTSQQWHRQACAFVGATACDWDAEGRLSLVVDGELFVDGRRACEYRLGVLAWGRPGELAGVLFPIPETTICARWSRDCRYLAIATGEGHFVVFTRGGNRIIDRARVGATCVEWLGSRRVAVGYVDGDVYVWPVDRRAVPSSQKKRPRAILAALSFAG